MHFMNDYRCTALMAYVGCLSMGSVLGNFAYVNDISSEMTIPRNNMQGSVGVAIIGCILGSSAGALVGIGTDGIIYTSSYIYNLINGDNYNGHNE